MRAVCPTCGGQIRQRDTTPLPVGDPIFGGKVLAVLAVTGIAVAAVQTQVRACPCGETRYLTATLPVVRTRKRYLRG